MVQTNTVAGPVGDAAIVRVKETGAGIAMALDGNGEDFTVIERELWHLRYRKPAGIRGIRGRFNLVI